MDSSLSGERNTQEKQKKMLDLQEVRRCVCVRIYLLAGRIPAKTTKHLKSHLVTRYLIRNKKQETRRSK